MVDDITNSLDEIIYPDGSKSPMAPLVHMHSTREVPLLVLLVYGHLINGVLWDANLSLSPTL